MFLRNHWVISLLVISGIIVVMYLLLYSATNAPIQLTEKTPVSAPTGSAANKDKYAEASPFSVDPGKQELESLYALGSSASPFDLRRIDFYEKGGLISASPELMEMSENGVKSIEEKYRQMESQGYYNVAFVTDLSRSAGLINKLKGFFKASGASNYHEGLQRVNEHLSFSAVDLNNSLFADIPRLVSETYGSVSYGRWSAIKHIFEHPEFGIIRLNEEQAGPAGKTVHLLPVEFKCFGKTKF